jgi:hypothetical protein
MAGQSIFKHEGRLGGSTELDAVGKPSLEHIGVFVRVCLRAAPTKVGGGPTSYAR